MNDERMQPANPTNPPPPASDQLQPKPAAARGDMLTSIKNILWPKTPPQGSHPHDSTREVAETVVFVVVLVLLLKSFIAEAFVIPTGSMADTLWGYQKVVVCPQCDTDFPVNCSQEVEPQRGQAPVIVTGCTCTNCRLQIQMVRGQTAAALAANEILDPGSNSGDRVLVVKYPYDFFPGKPNRFDVVVFKFPGDAGPDEPFPISGPQKDGIQMNYIKRLVGLGNETIGIWYGDLYRMKGEQAPKVEEGVEKKNLWRKTYMHEDDALSLLMDADRSFEILQKPPDKMLAVKRLVYNNDKPAKDLEKSNYPPRWAGEEGGAWTKAEANGFRHIAKEADNLSWLRYRHILRPPADAKADFKPAPTLITDFLGYNSYLPRRMGRESAPNWVGDLILECEVTVDDPKGELVLELSKGVDRFRARWDLASGKCVLLRTKPPHEGEKPPADDNFKDIADAMTSLKGKGTYRVRFANVDERLTVWVDGKMPFGDGTNYDAPKQKGPYANDLQPVSIGVKGGNVSVQHLMLWRDSYYTRDPSFGADAHLEADAWGDPKRWEPLRKINGKTLYVQPGHYLCLGDNSPESSDSRAWGTVPERLMLGRALAVYYPFYFPYWPLKSPVNRVAASPRIRGMEGP